MEPLKYWRQLQPWDRVQYGALKVCISGGLLIICPCPAPLKPRPKSLQGKVKQKIHYRLARWGKMSLKGGSFSRLHGLLPSVTGTPDIVWLVNRDLSKKIPINATYYYLLSEKWVGVRFRMPAHSKHVLVFKPKSGHRDYWYENGLCAAILPLDGVEEPDWDRILSAK